jgi:hypothetical protein
VLLLNECLLLLFILLWSQSGNLDIPSYEPKKDEVGGQLRLLHNKGLCDSHRSLSIVRIVNSRRLRLAGHAARFGEMNTYRILM